MAKLSRRLFVLGAIAFMLLGSCNTAKSPTSESPLGSVAIEGTPTRIVALEWVYVEDLLALGIQPVGVADVGGYKEYLKVQPALAASIVDVGTRQEPSLEAIARLEPDLIIGVQFRHEPIYDKLSAVAPTLLFNPYPAQDGPNQLEEMEQTMMAIAEAVKRREQGIAVLKQMRAAFEAATSTLKSANHAGSKLVLVQAFTENNTPQLRVFTDNSIAVQTLTQIGLENAWEGQFDPYGFNTVGVEALAATEDAHFFYVVEDEDKVFTQLSNNPVWRGFEFVKQGRVYPLGGNTWLFGGPISVQLLVEKVVAALVQKQ